MFGEPFLSKRIKFEGLENITADRDKVQLHANNNDYYYNVISLSC